MDKVEAALATIDEDELCRHVKRGEEHRHLDYKAPMPWDTRTEQTISLIKDILALANSGGGYLIIGVDELDNGTFRLAGLTDTEASTWETTKVGSKVRAHSDPPVELRVRVVECESKKFSVITVDGFRNTPHLCIRGYQSSATGKWLLKQPDLYVRTGVCESRVVQTAEELTDVLERAVRQRQDERLEELKDLFLRAMASQAPNVRDSVIALALQGISLESPGEPFDGVYTDVMFPAVLHSQRFTLEQLRVGLESSSKAYRPDWPFIQYRDWEEHIERVPDGYRMEYSEPVGTPNGEGGNRYFYWRLQRSGLLVVRSLAWEAGYFGIRGQRVLFKRSMVIHIAQALDALVSLYKSLGVDNEDITWRFEFSGAKGRDFRDAPGLIPFRESQPPTENVLRYERTLPFNEWRDNLVDHILEAVIDISEQLGDRFVNRDQVREDVRQHLRQQ